MYTGFNHLHSSLRYVLVLLIPIAIILAFLAIRKNKNMGGQFKLVKITFILTHVQLLVGLALYFISPWVQQVMQDASLIKINKELAFYSVKHPIQMLIAIVILTLGYVRAKKLSTVAQSKTLFVYWLVAFIIIFISIPWPFMQSFGTWY